MVIVMKMMRLPAARAALCALSLSAFQPLSEGCAPPYPPPGNPKPDAALRHDSGAPWHSDGGEAKDGGSCRYESERLFVGGLPAAFEGELFVLEDTSGLSAGISISDTGSGESTYVSVPQWGSETISFAGRTFTITVEEMSDASPGWADVDLSGC